jgi:two-component system phosphate regulon response regulator PhoB
MHQQERMFDMAEVSTEPSSQVLVVEDEAEIRELISLLLLRQGHRVQQCGSALEAIERLKNNQFDLIVLDWMLPHMSGVEFIRNHLKARQISTPVLMVTAKAEPENIVEGLEAGADDYVTKPFEPAIFTARAKALLRRSQQQRISQAVAKSELIVMGDLSINLSSYEVSCCGETIHMTPSEFKILSTMAMNRGRVLTRDQLIGVVQGEGISVTGRTIDTHVFGLRKKMESCADWIETIRGVGYRIKN